MKTNWREELDDSLYVRENIHPKHVAAIKAFIETLLEEVISEIPDNCDYLDVQAFKHQLRAKWLTKDASLAGERTKKGWKIITNI